MKELEFSHTADNFVKWYNHFVWQFSKKLNILLPYDLIILLLGTTQEKLECVSMQTFVHECSW